MIEDVVALRYSPRALLHFLIITTMNNSKFNCGRVTTRSLFSLFLIVLLSCVYSPTVAFAQVTEFSVPTAASSPFGIVSGPDGNLWFTEYTADKIGRATTAGVITEFAFSAGFGPAGVTTGPDGNLWACGFSGNKVARVTTAGVVTEFTVPTAASSPRSIVSGPDGNLWFTETDGNKIGKVTTAGTFTEFAIPTAASSPRGIALGADGNLWFTESATDKIGRVTTAGVFTEFVIPTAGSSPRNIIRGLDDALWFTQQGSNKIGRISTSGAISETLISSIATAPSGIVNGPSGTGMWFAESAAAGNKIGQISPLGDILSETAVTTAASGPEEITLGPDGNLWFTEYVAGKIGRLVPSNVLSVTTASPLPTAAVGVAYSQTLAATGGTTPYFFWQLLSGSLPAGILLSSSGTLGGVPTTTGNSTFTVEVTDDQLVTASKQYSLTVSDPRPDLSGTWQSASRRNLKVRGTFTVTNTGTNSAGPFIVDLYFSKDTTFSAKDVRVKRQSFSSLASGASATVKANFNRAGARNKYLLAVVDSEDSVDETDTTNNVVPKQIP